MGAQLIGFHEPSRFPPGFSTKLCQPMPHKSNLEPVWRIFGIRHDEPMFGWFESHRIRGTGIFTYIYHKNQPNRRYIYIYIYTPYMDPMGMKCVFVFSWQFCEFRDLFGIFGVPAPTSKKELLQQSGESPADPGKLSFFVWPWLYESTGVCWWRFWRPKNRLI